MKHINFYKQGHPYVEQNLRNRTGMEKKSNHRRLQLKLNKKKKAGLSDGEVSSAGEQSKWLAFGKGRMKCLPNCDPDTQRNYLISQPERITDELVISTQNMADSDLQQAVRDAEEGCEEIL